MSPPSPGIYFKERQKPDGRNFPFLKKNEQFKILEKAMGFGLKKEKSNSVRQMLSPTKEAYQCFLNVPVNCILELVSNEDKVKLGKCNSHFQTQSE
jgi:hypothetical protein